MLCYRAVDTTADEEGGGRDEEYEINSMGEPARTGKVNALRRCAGSAGKVVTILQHMKIKEL